MLKFYYNYEARIYALKLEGFWFESYSTIYLVAAFVPQYPHL